MKKYFILILLLPLSAFSSQVIPLRADRPFTAAELERPIGICLKETADDLQRQIFSYVHKIPQGTPKQICTFQPGTESSMGYLNCSYEYSDLAATFGVNQYTGRTLSSNPGLHVDYSTYDADDYRIRLGAKGFPNLIYQTVKHADVDDLGEESNIYYTEEKLRLYVGDDYGDHVALVSESGAHPTQIFVDMKGYVACMQREVGSL